MNIVVVNCKTYEREPEHVRVLYCGRGRAPEGMFNVQLGNPYIVGKHGKRGECCDLYNAALKSKRLRRHRKVISGIARRIVSQGYEEIRLACWCAPERCHCESIRDVLKDELNTGEFLEEEEK